MTDPEEPVAPTAPDPPARPRQPGKKDRLVQTRVPRELEHRIKEEAERRRMTVSQLVRNLLEDTVEFVGDVLISVDDIVADSVEFAGHVSRDAMHAAGVAARDGRRAANHGGRRRARSKRQSRPVRTDTAPDRASENDRVDPAPQHDTSLDHVAAWNPVILNRPVDCSRCGAELERGDHGYAGLGDGPVAWLCESCIDRL